MKTTRFALAAAFVPAILLAGSRLAHAQCSYPTLTDDVPQSFATTPAYARFVQSVGRWAAAGVRSSGSSNWDVGFSLGTAAFPSCLTLPVVASQQTSGVDFVLGDFGTQAATGTRYAPIARASGTGSATLEWDSGSRTAAIGTQINYGPFPAGLIDVWNANLVGGQSYSFFLYGGNPGDFTLYAFQRGGANTWRQKSDAVLIEGSNYSGPWVFTPSTTGSYPIVVVNENNSSSFYGFYLQACTNPVTLADGSETYVPVEPGYHTEHFQITPTVPGFSTVAVRPTPGEITSIGVAPRSGPGAFPPCDYLPVNSTNADLPVELVIGDFASGALTLGGTYWLGVSSPQAIGPDSWIEYDSGSTPLVVDGGTHKPLLGDHEVVRAYRADLTALTDVRVHVANCDGSDLRLWIFRAFDNSIPFGAGWSSPDNHPPLVAYDVYGISDYTFTPPVTGPYAFIVTKGSAGSGCFELGLSDCYPRLALPSGSFGTITTSTTLATPGQTCGTLSGVLEKWSAIAVRPNSWSEDWKISWSEDPTSGGGPPPYDCLGAPIVATDDPGTTSHVDFITRVGRPLVDLHDRIGTQRVFPVSNASPGGGARVEFEAATTSLAIDAPPIEWAINSGQIIGVWNVDLAAGQPYTFWFDPKQTGAELFLFRETSGCPGICDPEFSKLGGFGQEFRTTTPRSYTPTQSGTYGVIAVNQNAATGAAEIGVYAANVGVEPRAVPSAPRFEAVAPNPAPAGRLRFAFALPRPARVGFEILNLAGRIVARAEDADYPAGSSQRAWTVVNAEGRALTPGVYFARMTVDGQPAGQKKISIARAAN